MKRRDFIIGAVSGAVGGAVTGLVTCDIRLRLKTRAAMAAMQDGTIRHMNSSGASAPPGARSVSRLTSRCSACGLCISSCPGKALRAAGVMSYGLAGMMMPRLDFENGYCSPDCHKCAEVCPAKAIEKVPSPAERARIRTGIATCRPWECKLTKGEGCGTCVRNCPVGAISLAKDNAGPVVDAERCIGCGKCEHYCPAKPKAIVVKGLAVHEVARAASESAGKGG